ncbi:MAG TPA: hypothetical protein VLF71_03160 [Candidatus Saccharimonadales bacterium]|nr:hypothetical protein [Candidatus Saccharimonadales bacterium]
MANQNEPSGQQDDAGRGRHSPQHASATHTRLQTKPGEDAPVDDGGMRPHHRLWQWIVSNKKLSIPLLVVTVVGLLLAVPPTRYLLAGTVLRKNFSVLVTDSQTHKPVTSALVQLGGKTAATNNKGIASIKVRVGHATVAVSKKYYASASKAVLVPIGPQKQSEEISLAATGRQVAVSVTNKISGQPVANVTVAAQGTDAKTDAKGELTLVLPAGKETVPATLSGSGYNKQTVTIKVTAATDPANTFQITPAGKLYFLSNKSGTVDVVKTDLDGANRQTVLAGTGSEDKFNTVLLASQDWQYLALLSKRDGGANAKLFVINTANDSLATMDEGDADFTLAGWSGHNFVYTVDRHGMQQWQAGRQELKSYDADSGKVATLDQNAAGGTSTSVYFSESIDKAYILKGQVVYAKDLFASTLSDAGSHQATLNTVKPDGSGKQVVKGWTFSLPYAYYSTVSVTIDARPYEPSGLYVAAYFNPQPSSPDTNLYDYSGGKLTTVTGKITSDVLNEIYPTYLFSPSNSKTFWSEPRDGKNTLFVGDDDAQGGKEVASVSDYQTYGWYTDAYLLVSKNGSELYAMPAAGGTPLKITDYYKPSASFYGYGGGYGGL